MGENFWVKFCIFRINVVFLKRIIIKWWLFFWLYQIKLETYFPVRKFYFDVSAEFRIFNSANFFPNPISFRDHHVSYRSKTKDSWPSVAEPRTVKFLIKLEKIAEFFNIENLFTLFFKWTLFFNFIKNLIVRWISHF